MALRIPAQMAESRNSETVSIRRGLPSMVLREWGVLVVETVRLHETVRPKCGENRGGIMALLGRKTNVAPRGGSEYRQHGMENLRTVDFATADTRDCGSLRNNRRR